MKPHEETDWTHSDLFDWFDRSACRSPEAHGAISARGRLATYAPDMARLLLKYIDQEAECLSCGEGVYWDDVTDSRVQPHLADCELQTVLRNAGVID